MNGKLFARIGQLSGYLPVLLKETAESAGAESSRGQCPPLSTTNPQAFDYVDQESGRAGTGSIGYSYLVSYHLPYHPFCKLGGCLVERNVSWSLLVQIRYNSNQRLWVARTPFVDTACAWAPGDVGGAPSELETDLPARFTCQVQLYQQRPDVGSEIAAGTQAGVCFG